MRVLVVSAHPSGGSYVAAVRERVLDAVVEAGHLVRHRDLCAEGFDPVFTEFERVHHVGDPAEKLGRFPELSGHVEDLRWCEAMVLVYPTWWSGQPAVLKGWFDRVLMNGVAWELPEGAARLRPMLSNVRRLVVVTTHGSGKFTNMLEGEAGKRTAFRSVRLMFSSRTRCRWIAMYGLDRSDERARSRFLSRVGLRVVRALGRPRRSSTS